MVLKDRFYIAMKARVDGSHAYVTTKHCMQVCVTQAQQLMSRQYRELIVDFRLEWSP